MKHIVKITTTFTHTQNVGALVVDDKEISPAKTTTTEYTEGTEIQFPTKANAIAFVKFHGNDKMAYVGKR
jgi:hypothetical protein